MSGGGVYTMTAANELEQLIADQARDAATDRVWSLSLDSFPSCPDTPKPRLRAHDDRHGTLACYTHLRCRCDKCRATIAAHARQQRAIGRWDTRYEKQRVRVA